MKSRERLHYWIAGCVFVVITVGICVALLNQPTAINQSNQAVPRVAGKNWWEMDLDEWWDETPDGQDATRRLMSGELSIQDVEFIFREMGEGKSYEEARTMIGHGFSRLKRYAATPKRAYEAFLEEDWKPAVKAWWESAEKKAGRSGVVGAVAIGLGDICIGSVRAVGKTIPEIIAGRESGGQAFGVLAIVLVMAWLTWRSAKIIQRAEPGTIARFNYEKQVEK